MVGFSCGLSFGGSLGEEVGVILVKREGRESLEEVVVVAGGGTEIDALV